MKVKHDKRVVWRSFFRRGLDAGALERGARTVVFSEAATP